MTHCVLKPVFPLTVLLLMPFYWLQSQLNQGGTPLSFDLETRHKDQLSQVKTERMPDVDFDALSVSHVFTATNSLHTHKMLKSSKASEYSS